MGIGPMRQPDSFNKLSQKLSRDFQEGMQEITKLSQKLSRDFQEGMQEITNDLYRDALDPAKLMELARRMGIDMSQLPGVISQQPGFNPYRILGLDKSATDEEVKQRYREHVYKFHPDTAGTPGTEFHFQMALMAYELIKKQRGWQ